MMEVREAVVHRAATVRGAVHALITLILEH